MPDPIASLIANLQDVERLLEIHEEATGAKPGRRFDVEVLNKSGIVLTVACWEAFVEDCATEAFNFVLAKSPDATKVPAGVRKLVAKALKGDSHELSIWQLAGEGWRTQLSKHREATIKKYVSPLNTPRHGNVDSLFADLLDLSEVSGAWKWHRMSAQSARTRLSDIITLRGEIAHRVNADAAVHKKEVEDAVTFIGRIANLTSNAVRVHVNSVVGAYPWPAQPEPGKPGRPRKI